MLGIAGKLPEADVEARRRRDWDRLDVAKRRQLYAYATAELSREADDGSVPLLSVAITARAMQLMDKEKADGRVGEQGALPARG